MLLERGTNMRRRILLGGIIVGIVILGIVLALPDSEDIIQQNTQLIEESEMKEPESEVEMPEAEKPNSEEPESEEEETETEASDADNSKEEELSLYHFLENALKPVGNTMYIWGGGWNEEDTGAGVGATYIGLYPKWKDFMNKQDADYDYKQHRYELENGLDCSGFVGWTIYNTFEKENGKEGYVTNAKKMAVYFANKGWGHLIENPKQFLPGDIVSMASHVWICLGTCADGSVLLVHASPPGVSVCGTKGIAEDLAKEYMSSLHADWQNKYPKREVPHSYIENVTLFRWTKGTMADAEELQSLTGEEMIRRYWDTMD